MKYSLVVIGTSMGGLEALDAVLSALPGDYPIPVVVVYHRGPRGDEAMGALIQKRCRLPVGEVEDKEKILGGRVYVAPAGYHLLVEPSRFALSVDEPENYSRPSIDALFETAADAYGAGLAGVVLTGMSEDGAAGAARIKARGGLLVVEDPATAAHGQMPAAAVRAAKPDRVLPVGEIGSFLAGLGSKTAGKKEGEGA